MPIRDCFGKYKLHPDKLAQFEKMVKDGANEYAAAREIVFSEYEGLNKRMNDIRKTIGLTQIKTPPPEDISPKIKKINNKNNK